MILAPLIVTSVVPTEALFPPPYKLPMIPEFTVITGVEVIPPSLLPPNKLSILILDVVTSLTGLITLEVTLKSETKVLVRIAKVNV